MAQPPGGVSAADDDLIETCEGFDGFYRRNAGVMLRVALALVCVEWLKVEHRHVDARLLIDQLRRLSVSHREAGTQGLVPADDRR